MDQTVRGWCVEAKASWCIGSPPMRLVCRNIRVEKEEERIKEGVISEVEDVGADLKPNGTSFQTENSGIMCV